MNGIELNAEIITGIVSIIGGIILILFKFMGIRVDALKNFFKRGDSIDSKMDILHNLENLIKHDSLKFVTKAGIVIQFTEISKPQQSDYFSEYLNLLIYFTRELPVSYRKLTLDFSKVRIFNSLFVGAIASTILNTKKDNGLKLLLIINKNSRLYDLISNFEMLKEDATSIEIKILKDYHE